MKSNSIQLRIKGKVQGVGFRPYVWQVAHELSLKGDVCNDSEGVLIRLWCDEKLAKFQELLYERCPPLARIDAIIVSDFTWQEAEPVDFSIRHSGEGKMDTQVIPDAATCPVCQAEIFDPTNRRYHYPFTNCTHCGPRFTIIKKMPYDRPYTAMASFPFCPTCKKEYEDPADRRFHAQPNACPDCGPHVWYCDSHGTQLSDYDKALEQAAADLLAGQIVAIKGLGGFHLACDATNEAAVRRLRERKHRPSKPFALMAPDLDAVKACVVSCSRDEETLLLSAAAPIVLLKQHPESQLCSQIAPGLSEVGFMLPSNPLQHLLFALVKRPLVMTSGNASGKPPVLTNEEAMKDLQGIADVWLLHNRDIIQRADDSLLRCFTADDAEGEVVKSEVLRRARGYVPDAFTLPAGFENAPSILAIGADLKNTFCLLRDKTAVLSQHFGDLDDLDIQAQFRKTLTLFLDIYKFTPDAVVIDAHPDYFSRRLGEEVATRFGVPLLETLHHHAHITSCLAEHAWPKTAGKVIGLTLDGLGYGEKHQLWGGECLLADYESCHYLGGLPAVALPGGNRASKEPWRNLFAQLHQFMPDWTETDYPELSALKERSQGELTLLGQAIDKGLNSPKASSTGRLFDAVAAALGICPQGISWEGEAACKLEVLAQKSKLTDSPVTMPISDNHLDLASFWRQWLDFSAPIEDKAFAFHAALADGLAALAKRHAAQQGVTTLVLCGGVLHNQLLRRRLTAQLAPLSVIYPEMLPMGDGGLSLGQAVNAISLLKRVK